ncbi:CorA family divalent cation transporter [Vibrio crassostreae]|uniref:CorA family divalent cation transporter n=1 Tax=Vibrio crassostreae TaxID=246167 RepID=UPI00104CB33B|nr:CorA family divalent cation transporter [Vibrio crassostreae]TCO05136.1 zinc transporter [Vibrio crassostreae]CAK1835567.1 zinc transporter [Vibrio crassostreae]CAK1844510.1 zinc transporter [Vibrio crassostreae]CAK1869414.1 zinc transporter [Vibrio crassostreae]CAK1985410.1 zinc transporter [Vibrio crassostreae]
MDAFIISSWQFSEGAAHEHNTSPAPFEQSTWYHCQRDAEGLREWLQDNTVPNAIVDSLLTDDTRPRFEQFGNDCFLIILRGINLNEGANPDDMLSLRILWYKGTLISTRKVASKAVSNLVSDLKQGHGPTSLPDVLLGIIRGINHYISAFLTPVEQLIDDLESESHINIKSINALHSRLLRLRRYLKPQKYVFEDLMSELPAPLSKHNTHIKNSLDTMLRINESVEFYIEQINVFLASLSQQQAEKMNRNTYLFSIIAGIFLPAGFFTGLLGVNIAGIPGTDNPIAFPLFCVGLLVVVAAEVIILKKLRFI